MDQELLVLQGIQAVKLSQLALLFFGVKRYIAPGPLAVHLQQKRACNACLPTGVTDRALKRIHVLGGSSQGDMSIAGALILGLCRNPKTPLETGRSHLDPKCTFSHLACGVFGRTHAVFFVFLFFIFIFFMLLFFFPFFRVAVFMGLCGVPPPLACLGGPSCLGTRPSPRPGDGGVPVAPTEGDHPEDRPARLPQWCPVTQPHPLPSPPDLSLRPVLWLTFTALFRRGRRCAAVPITGRMSGPPTGPR